MGILTEFFNGNIYPFEAVSSYRGAAKAEKRFNAYLEKVDECIPKEDKTFFSDKIRNEVYEIQNITAQEAFEYGFSLGVRFTAECYKES